MLKNFRVIESREKKIGEEGVCFCFFFYLTHKNEIRKRKMEFGIHLFRADPVWDHLRRLPASSGLRVVEVVVVSWGSTMVPAGWNCCCWCPQGRSLFFSVDIAGHDRRTRGERRNVRRRERTDIRGGWIPASKTLPHI